MGTRPITDTLRHIGGGVFIDLASDKMNAALTGSDGSAATGRSG